MNNTNQTNNVRRRFSRAALLSSMAGLMMAASTGSVSAQICLHGGSLTENTFSTNCLGQIVFGKTHVGSTVGVLIRANMVDDCPGDQTLITNIVDRISFNSTTFFTTTNLIAQPILLPSLGSSSNIINVTSGPFAGSAYTYIVPANAAQVITNTATQNALDTNSVTNPNGLLGGVGSAQIQVLRPALRVTKVCNAGIGETGIIGFSGTVSNAGDVVLTNVLVFNSQPTNNTPVVGPITLAVGQSVNFNGSYRPALPCGPATDTLTAFGTDELRCTVTATATQTCTNQCAPVIKVWKQVVCYSNTCEPFSSNLDTQKTATGVRVDPQNDANCPAFCYRITVTNQGNVTLSNVTVVDQNLSDNRVLNLSCFPAGLTLAPAGQPNSSFTCVVTTNHCVNSTNIVTATGVGLVTGGGTQTVTSTDTNRVVVNPMSVNCLLLVSTNAGASFAQYSSTNCANQLIGQGYIVRLIVRNTGSVPLIATVTDTVGSLAGCITSPLNLAAGQSVTNDCTRTCTSGGTANYAVSVVAVASQAAGRVCDVNLQSQQIRATSSCNTCVTCQGLPAIKVYKQVVCWSNMCEPFNTDLNTQKSALGVSSGAACPAFCYRITVTNQGNVTLSNLVVSDLNLTDGKTLNLSGCGFPSTLAPAGQPGSSASCIVTTNHCVTSTNIVTASGVGQSASGTLTVTSTDTNRVTVNPISVRCEFQILTNGVVVPGACPRFPLGTTSTVRLRVMNDGQYPLQNVTVTNVAGLCFGGFTNIGSLAVGETKTIDCSNVCSATSSNFFAASVVASASESQGHVCAFTQAGQPIRATSSCSACVACAGQPRICVTKEVVCELPAGCATNWSKLATGAKTAGDSQCPSFCYRIRVTNCGDEELRNVTVVDNRLSLSGCTFPTTLAAGQSSECLVSGVIHCNNVTNTVTATGVGAFSGISTNATDTAAVVVRPISITCRATVNGQPSMKILCDGQGHLITNAVEVCNTGSLPLSDITIAAPNLSALGCTNVANLRLSLLPGQCTNVVLCIDMVTCPPDCSIAFSNHIRITATVDQSLTNVCSWTRNQSGQVVAVTASTECDAVVECEAPPKAGCTPGFWKNCTIHWQPTPYRTDQKVSSVFTLGNCCATLGNASLLGAMDFGGGGDVCGAARNLLRAAVAALLNASSPEVDYPVTEQDVIGLVSAALQSCNRSTMLALASELDQANNLGCNDANGNSLPCKRLSDVQRVAPAKAIDSRVAPTR
jgi:hypothetical protein